MLCDAEGLFPDELNEWERTVLQAEMGRDDRLAWYRNPPRASQDSLGIVYDDADEKRLVRPDFVFFSGQSDGSILADLIDPHGHHLADSLPKLHGLPNAEPMAGAEWRDSAGGGEQLPIRAGDTVRGTLDSARLRVNMFFLQARETRARRPDRPPAHR